MLKGEQVILRALKSSDAANLAKNANDFDLWLNVRDSMPHPYKKKDAKKFIEFAQSPERVNLTFAIEHKAKVIGCISAEPQTDIERHNMELGYWIGKDFREQGLTTEAVSLICNYLFANFPINRIYSLVFEKNISSHKVLLKNGFREEALLLESAYKNGRFVNEYLFSLLRIDWEGLSEI